MIGNGWTVDGEADFISIREFSGPLVSSSQQ
jgi:hypothetical protein